MSNLYLIIYLNSKSIKSIDDPIAGMYELSLLLAMILSLFCHILIVRLHHASPDSRPPSWLRRLSGACSGCAQTKPRLPTTEPSYLSHMQMLRERLHQSSGIPAPEWNLDRAHPVAAGNSPIPDIHPMMNSINETPITTMPSWNHDDQPPPPPELGPRMGAPPQFQAPAPPMLQQPPPQLVRSWGDGPRAPPHTSSVEMLLSRQLHVLRSVTDRLHEEEQTRAISGEWRRAARAINCLVAVVAAVAYILLPVLIFVVVPVVTPDARANTDDLYVHSDESQCSW
jgi:hypothetical protein